jgi:Alpha-L-arabinofuranosidase B (ABFB) domain
MSGPGSPSGAASGADPAGRFPRLVRPYIGDGGPASPADVHDDGRSEGVPAPPLPPDTAPSEPVAAARHRRGGTAGRHRPAPAAPHQRLRAALARPWSGGVKVAGMIATAGIAVLTIGLVLAWSGHPATARTPSCQPGGCGGSTSHALGPALAKVSSSASAHATAATSAKRTATPHPSSSVPATASAHGSASATAPSTAATAPGPSSSPATSTGQLAPGSLISINATTACCTLHYIRHDDRDDRVVITRTTQGSSALAKADATWVVRAGLAGSGCISLESANEPGQYLRHHGFELYLEPDDGSAQFALDATFCPRPGNSGNGYSFQSANYPNMYIRHYDYVVYIASYGGASPWDNNLSVWPEDTTWLVTQPWG